MKTTEPSYHWAKYISIGSLFYALLVFLLLISCGQDTSQEDVTLEASPTNTDVHVAFAGGGWRAHTGHSAWTMSLLDNGKVSLADAFTNVKTVSSNSGGSWFSTMLLYSKKFTDDIQAVDALSNWSIKGKGWLGEQKYLYSNSGTFCEALSGDKYLACVANKYASATHWKEFIEKVVYNGYSLDTTKLSDPHLAWAKDKSLLLAATMLTNNVVLNEKLTYLRYYQTCKSPSTVVFGGEGGSSCTPDNLPDVTPVTFSSLPVSSAYKPRPFLPELGTGSGALQFNLGYTENGSYDIDKDTTSIRNPIDVSDVVVMTAASTSSAAAGFGASYNVTKSWLTSYAAYDLAISYSLKDSKASYQSTSNMSYDDLLNGKMVRLADGGAVDNSGVAQLVGFLQQTGQDNNFNIVAFDNVQGVLFANGENTSPVGQDIAMLFGEGLCPNITFCSGASCFPTCVAIPQSQIFESAALQSTPTTWSYATGSGVNQMLIYTKYEVTTKDNPVYGIKANSKGTLHAFTCVYGQANTAPQNLVGKGDFFTYEDMLQFINEGLNYGANKDGLNHLKAAFGLK